MVPIPCHRCSRYKKETRNHHWRTYLLGDRHRHWHVVIATGSSTRRRIGRLDFLDHGVVGRANLCFSDICAQAKLSVFASKVPRFSLIIVITIHHLANAQEEKRPMMVGGAVPSTALRGLHLTPFHYGDYITHPAASPVNKKSDKVS
jgi:hypothetical protein